MEIMSKRSKLEEMILVVVGCILLAASVNMIFEPIGLVTGGVSGIAIIVKYYTSFIFEGGIPVWVSNTAINIPLFLIAWRVLGSKYVKKTIFAAVCFSVALGVVPRVVLPFDDLLLAAVFGGVLGGAGLGLVFSTYATTGGTDLLSAIVQHYVRHRSVAKMLLFIDGSIVVAGAAVFGLRKAAYAVIAVYITTKVMDSILEGL